MMFFVTVGIVGKVLQFFIRIEWGLLFLINIFVFFVVGMLLFLIKYEE